MEQLGAYLTPFKTKLAFKGNHPDQDVAYMPSDDAHLGCLKRPTSVQDRPTMHIPSLFEPSLAFLALTPPSHDRSLANRATPSFHPPAVNHIPHDLSTAAERFIRHGVVTGACDSWRPPHDGSNAHSERGCWKDTWYAQLTDVLGRWEDEDDLGFSKLSWSHELNAANHATLTHLLTCLPFFHLPTALSNAHGCTNNALTVLLSANWWLGLTLLKTGESGEVVWMRTMVETLREEGYSFLSVSHTNYAGLIKLYAAIPNVITTIWASEALTISCLSDPFCRADFPRAQASALGLGDVRGAIPSWKMMTVSYWGAHPTSWEFGQQVGDGFAFNPLGHEWALVPFPYPGHTHIPISLEKTCASIPYVHPNSRSDTAVVLGKLTSYFFPNRSGDLPPPPSVWSSFLSQTGLQPIANARALSSAPEEPHTTPEGVENRGPLTSEEYMRQVGNARVMIGVGLPAISPSPYLALCQGVPVVIPYDGKDPTPSGFGLYAIGRTQHGPAASLGEPYVYSYNRHDKQSLLAAVRKARANPILPFIPDEMLRAHVARLTLQAVNRDYHSLSLEIERQRQHEHGEDAVRVPIPDYVRETVFRNGWGMRMMRDGTVRKTLLDNA